MDSVYPVGKSKRKEIDEVNDEFLDFSLSSPARKIRRLDAELSPIIEEEEPVVSVGLSQLEREGSGGSNARRGLVIEELPIVQDNEDRALVVFRPRTTPLARSPSNFTVDPSIVSGFKNQVLWPNQRDRWTAYNVSREHDKDSEGANECLAMVPWVPSQCNPPAESEVAPQIDSADTMEAEDMEEARMDIEEEGDFGHTGGMNSNQGFQHWQQQHCLVPQPPQNTSMPLVWFR